MGAILKSSQGKIHGAYPFIRPIPIILFSAAVTYSILVNCQLEISFCSVDLNRGYTELKSIFVVPG
jgi:hypothetical protein